MILIVVSIIIIALIIYTMTLEKIKEISILKLIGIPNFTIAKMIIQETVTLGVFAFISGNIFAYIISGGFPKRIVLLASRFYCTFYCDTYIIYICLFIWDI